MPTVSMAARSMVCIWATETARGGRCDGLETASVGDGGWFKGWRLPQAAGGGVAGVSAAASSLSFAAAFRPFIFICLILGRASTERPSVHRPCVMRCRTRSCRFMTLRSAPRLPLAVRSEE